MTGLVTVDLDQQHIDAGNRAAACGLSLECNCPVSHALAEAGFRNPKVKFDTFTAGDVTSFASSEGKRRQYKLPAAACSFIVDFDDNRHVEPFSFEIDTDNYAEVFYG